MNILTLRILASMTLLLGVAVFGDVANAASTDSKTISPTNCRPVGPGTLVSELTFNSYGIFNPGDTNESVMCDLPTDMEVGWSATPGTSANLAVYFRAGAVPGKVTCTAYTGSTVVSNFPTYAVTYNPASIVAGSRSGYTLALAEVSQAYGYGPTANVICTLTPKAALGMFVLTENGLTNLF